MKIAHALERIAADQAQKSFKHKLARPALDFIPRVTKAHKAPSVRRKNFLAAGTASPTPLELERLMGTNDLVDGFYLQRALVAATPVCRIGLLQTSGKERGVATGFMISPRLLLTNEHVLTSADEAAPSVAEFNYTHDIAGRPVASYRFRLRPDLYFHNDPKLDFAIVSVDPMSMEGNMPLSNFGFLKLIPETGKVEQKEWMTIIQHPGGSRRQYAIRENQCVLDDNTEHIWYMSDTAQGSSGAPVFNDSMQVVALHRAGVPRKNKKGQYVLKDGTVVRSIKDRDDSEVDWEANMGVRVSRICEAIATKAQERNGHLTELRAAMRSGDIMEASFRSPAAVPGSTTAGVAAPSAGRIVIGNLVVELNTAAATNQLLPPVGDTRDPVAGGGAAEAYKQPFVDTPYTGRKGFNTRFLGVSTPLPRVTRPSVLAPLLTGGTEVKYEHYSLKLHKERKLAVFTACNVDGSPTAKRPEPGKAYTRKALTGLGDFEFEAWVMDPRVDPKYQIPDEFYNKDKGAFDKGHICRREDVCFGTSHAQVRRANGDTYHLTNCSPQRKGFNQSGDDGIWGKLENYIGKQAKNEKYCVFAGPVLADDDQVFPGTERVKLPVKFWKVVCAVENGTLRVYAFILEQEVADLPLEFQVDAEWKRKQVKLKELETVVGLLKFQKKYHDADQG